MQTGTQAGIVTSVAEAAAGDLEIREERMSFWLAVAALAAALTGHSIAVAAQDAVHVIPESHSRAVRSSQA